MRCGVTKIGAWPLAYGDFSPVAGGSRRITCIHINPARLLVTGAARCARGPRKVTWPVSSSSRSGRRTPSEPGGGCAGSCAGHSGCVPSQGNDNNALAAHGISLALTQWPELPSFAPNEEEEAGKNLCNVQCRSCWHKPARRTYLMLTPLAVASPPCHPGGSSSAARLPGSSATDAPAVSRRRARPAA
jgi:hypothetical protein